MPLVQSNGITIEDFWDGWFAPAVANGSLTQMETVFATVNGIEFLADGSVRDRAFLRVSGGR